MYVYVHIYVDETLIRLDQQAGETKKLDRGGHEGPAHKGRVQKGPAHKGPAHKGPGGAIRAPPIRARPIRAQGGP